MAVYDGSMIEIQLALLLNHFDELQVRDADDDYWHYNESRYAVVNK